jgi:hypothetical protein
VHEDDPAHLAVLDDLRRRAVETYGEDRAANTTLQTILRVAATAVWRVLEEPLEPSDVEP